MVLADTICEYQQRVDHQLKLHLQQQDNHASTLKAAMSHGALQGGKRIRPFLVYSVGNMLGVPLQQLDNCAAAIECIHAYSLIHDDLPAMDDDDLRRGQPTVHIAFDEATAILAGDALQSLAFDILSQPVTGLTAEQQLRLIRSLATAAGYQGMCGGQAIDLASEGQRIDLAQLSLLHSKKTGALIKCAIEMALICANASDSDRESLLTYADAIGLAFQVQDDILDITSTTEVLGKPQGSDTQANKSTFPQLMGIEDATATSHQLIADALSALTALPYNSQLIADFARYIIERKV